jgi:hypothetical protein
MTNRTRLIACFTVFLCCLLVACGSDLGSGTDAEGDTEDAAREDAPAPDTDGETAADETTGPDAEADGDADEAPPPEAADEADAAEPPGFHETGRAVVGSGFHPRLQADDAGRLHLLVHDGRELFYRTWSGSAWSAPELVPGSDGVSSHKATRHRMSVARDGTRVFVSWGTGWGNDIRFAYRDSAGWHGPETACSASVRPWEYAAVAGRSAGDAYVFCMVDDLWVAHRSPAGAWDGPTNIWTGAAKHVAAVTTASDEIHGTFRFARVYYFHGNGSAWSDVHEVTTRGDSAELPAIVVDGAGVVHLAWQRWLEEGGWHIDSVRYSRGNDDSWSGGGPGVLVHTYATQASNQPELAVDARGRVLVAWVEGTEVLLSPSLDGSTFSGPYAIAGDPADVAAGALENDLATPPIVVLGSDVHVVYENSSSQITHLVGTVSP